jgi:hypothetical protein
MRLCRAAAQRYLPTRRLGRLRCPPLDDPWSRRGLPRKSGRRRRSASSAEANSEWWSSQWLLLKRGSLRGSKSISWLVRFELQRRPQHPLARNDEIASLRATKQPDGQISKSCPAPREKIFRLTRRANQRYQLARLTRQEGRLAIVTNVRWDAVDARVTTDERDLSGRRSRVVLAPRCWR